MRTIGAIILCVWMLVLLAAAGIRLLFREGPRRSAAVINQEEIE